jgi:hypothetical protein
MRKTGKLVHELSNSEIQTSMNEGTIKLALISEQFVDPGEINFQNEQNQIKTKKELKNARRSSIAKYCY